MPPYPERVELPCGRVAGVQAFPVKSLQARPPASVELDADGVAGDRRYAVLTDDGVVTAEQAPQLRSVVAALGTRGEPVLRPPGDDADLSGADADAALSMLLGRPARLAPVPAGSQLDAPVHLVSVQALGAAARGEHACADCACSLQEPRANLVLDVPGPDAVPEHAWIGRQLAVGEAMLRVVRRPGHCLGVYAEVERPGRVGAGDEVRLVDAPGGG
jgi:uncharacterized protein YcbX